MKKVYASFVALLILKSTFAATHIVQVINNQFSPAIVNVTVGDVVQWTWVEGFHTTTSLTIPPGAASWDQQLNNGGVTTFNYTVTIAGTYDYQCNFHAPAMAGTITANSSLPVVLNNFKISPAKAGAALVTWSTATEENTDHFEVMRSTNGINFENIASVPAKGNSSTLVNYSYTDNAVPANYRYLYYSLAIVDKDGKRALSDIQMYKNVNGSSKLIVSLSPNPISRPGHLMLQFNSEKAGSMHVQLFDAMGKLAKQDDLSAVAGLNNGHFHIGDVAPGTYTIVFTMDAEKESYKIVVQ